MHRTVHLEDLRCDGAGHDGCQAACLLYFKEAWLKRADGPRTEARPAPAVPERLVALTREGERYMCQATEAYRASETIGTGYGHYLRDVRTGNATTGQVITWEITRLLNKLQNLRGMYSLIERFRGPFRVPRIKGSLTKTPVGRLDLAKTGTKK